MAKMSATTGSRKLDTATCYSKKSRNRQAKKSNMLIDSGRCMLLELPKELRLMILMMLVVFTSPLAINFRFDLSAFAALSRTNRQLREDVLDLYFSKNTIHFGAGLFKGWAHYCHCLPKGSYRFFTRMQHIEVNCTSKPPYEWIEERKWNTLFTDIPSLKTCTVLYKSFNDRDYTMRKSLQYMSTEESHPKPDSQGAFVRMIEATEPNKVTQVIFKRVEDDDGSEMPGPAVPRIELQDTVTLQVDDI